MAGDAQPLLTVVMPVYNERATVVRVVERVLGAPVGPIELIVVDDGSDDGTSDVLRSEVAGRPGVRLIHHDENRGKGAALRTGFAAATGRFVLVQDADEEYNPADYPALLRPLLDGVADVVYGSRFLAGTHRVLYYWHSVANHMLTTMSNMITDLNLTDMETCYKVLRREVVQSLDLRENGFGIEPEITAKVAGLGVRIYEVPISYYGRTYAEGKKIGVRDAFRAVYCIARYGIPARIRRPDQ